MSLLLITTGGTIGAMPYADPMNPPEFSTMPPDNQDFVCDFLKNSSTTNTRTINAGHRDSKLIDQAYRLKLFQLIEESSENKILITHGTDTLIQTAEFLRDKIKQTVALANKTIILTGAMTPLANGAESDGSLNLTFSLEALTQQPISGGVYIVLCDYDQAGTGWTPHLYPCASASYEKLYDKHDGRRHRIHPIKN